MESTLINTIDTKSLTIDSREIDEMMDIKHYQILEKLEGTKTVKGIIPILNNHKIMPVDYLKKIILHRCKRRRKTML